MVAYTHGSATAKGGMAARGTTLIVTGARPR